MITRSTRRLVTQVTSRSFRTEVTGPSRSRHPICKGCQTKVFRVQILLNMVLREPSVLLPCSLLPAFPRSVWLFDARLTKVEPAAISLSSVNVRGCFPWRNNPLWTLIAFHARHLDVLLDCRNLSSPAWKPISAYRSYSRPIRAPALGLLCASPITVRRSRSVINRLSTTITVRH